MKSILKYIVLLVGIQLKRGSYTPAVEKQLYQWFDSSDKIVALGEIGLDYYWMNDSKEVQTKVFRRQIAMAKELGLPFSVHTRDALAIRIKC